MSVTNDTEKKFEMKYVFKDAKNQIIDGGHGAETSGPVEEHFGVKWKLRLYNCDNIAIYVYLDCLHNQDSGDWSIETELNVLYEGDDSNEITEPTFTKNEPIDWSYFFISEYDDFFTSDDMSVEIHVTIKKMAGIEEKKKKLRAFDDDDAKESLDVVLKIGDQKFYVCKMYLGFHSSYFKSLFFGNFVESQKSEIELKDIDPNDFQNYLELIYAETSIEADSVLGILHIADFSDSKTVVRRCQEFLVQKSELPLHQKFEAAIKYNLEELKTKCIADINSATDFESIVPENSGDFNTDVWKELLKKSISMIPK